VCEIENGPPLKRGIRVCVLAVTRFYTTLPNFDQETMNRTPLLSLSHSPSTSTPEPNDPSPLPPPTPISHSVPSASTSEPIDLIPPALPSPSRLHRRRPPVVPLTPDEEAAASQVSARYVTAGLITVQQILSETFPKGCCTLDRRSHYRALPRCRHAVS